MIYEDLKSKKVLVTGASSGIGQATAIEFARQGCFVGVHYFRTKDGAEKTLAEVKKQSDGCSLRADMRDEGRVNQIVARFAETAGGIDVLVNNAGTLIERRPLQTATQLVSALQKCRLESAVLRHKPKFCRTPPQLTKQSSQRRVKALFSGSKPHFKTFRLIT